MKRFLEVIRKPQILITILFGMSMLAIAAIFNQGPFVKQPAVMPAPAAVESTLEQAVPVKQPLIRPGAIVKAAAVPIAAQATGRLSAVYVSEGQVVEAGQPLFRLEPLGENAAIPAGQKAAKIQPDYEELLQQVNRLQKLYDQGAIPRKQLENAAAQLELAKTREKNNSGAAPVLQEPITVQAPLAGMITGLSATADNTVGEAQQILAIGSGQPVDVMITLDQADLDVVTLGTVVTIIIEGQKTTGQVTGIYPQVQDKKVISFQGRIKLHNPPTNLREGMAVNTQIEQ